MDITSELDQRPPMGTSHTAVVPPTSTEPPAVAGGAVGLLLGLQLQYGTTCGSGWCSWGCLIEHQHPLQPQRRGPLPQAVL